MARRFHRDEPPRRLVHATAGREQTVTDLDRHALVPELHGELFALLDRSSATLGLVAIRACCSKNTALSCVIGSKHRPRLDHALPCGRMRMAHHVGFAAALRGRPRADGTRLD